MTDTVTQNTVRNLGAFVIGPIEFNGARHTTKNVSGDQFAYAEFTVPDPLPPGWLGKISRIAAYASMDGDPPAVKWMCINPTVGVWTKPIGSKSCVQGASSVQLMVCFGKDSPWAMRVNAGDRLYVNIQNRMLWMGSGSLDTESSCGPGHQCDFSMDASLPS